MISYNIITGDTLTKVFQRIPGVDKDNILIGRHIIIICVTIIFTLPLSLYQNISKLGKVIANVFFSGNLTTVCHVALTVIVVAAATSISLMYDCLGIVLELNGVLSATPLVFILPAACYLKLSQERWTHWDSLLSGLILAIGVLVMTVGFVMTVLQPQECSHGKEMPYCFRGNSSFYNNTFLPSQSTRQP
ncbi:hypothetical protein lerEdw1_017448 [Lerista edwardsae]|nr:hypothetical protein lerEdw1_017448 [Lerista edwardsae]